MRNLVESILNKDYTKANDHLHEELKIIVARKLNEAKKMLAAKISVKEQLKVDDKAKFRESTGNKKLVSIEKSERGLTEGDVVPLDPSKRKKETDAVTKHVGKEHTVLGSDGQMSVYDNEGKHKFTIDNGSSMTAYYRHYDKHGDVEAALDHMKKNTIPSYTKPKTADIETMKEEAKRAAMKSLQEKVRVRGGITPEEIEAARARSAETNEEPQKTPAGFFRKRNRETVVPFAKSTKKGKE